MDFLLHLLMTRCRSFHKLIRRRIRFDLMSERLSFDNFSELRVKCFLISGKNVNSRQIFIDVQGENFNRGGGNAQIR